VRRSDQRRAAVFALYQSDVTGRPLDELIPPTATTFTRELVDGTMETREELDAMISRYARGWSLDRIAPLERSILRVALYELFHRDDVPDEVAIDEAIESAKSFCGADAPAFVNGILGTVKRDRSAAR
jgi:transcription antitermination protein NusB